MLPAPIKVLLEEQIAADLQTKGRTQKEVFQAGAQKAVSGYGGNAGSLRAVEVANEIQKRAEMISASIQIVLGKVRLTPYPMLSDDLEALYNTAFDRIVVEWRPHLAQAWSSQGGMVGQEPVDLQSKLDTWRLANRMNVKLLAVSIMEPILNGNQITISFTNSPVGVFQTGEGSVSVGIIALSQQDADALRGALAEIDTVLGSPQGVGPAAAAELKEVVVDAHAALNRPTLNMTKIKGALITVVAGIKGIARLTGAYDTISAFLKAHGVDILP